MPRARRTGHQAPATAIVTTPAIAIPYAAGWTGYTPGTSDRKTPDSE
jgi:hypothetical protein